MDEAHRQTDKLLAEIERNLRKEYRQATKETEKKLNKYFKAFERKDAAKREQVKNGEISSSDYKKWRVSQLAVGKRWEDMRDALAQDMANTNIIARSIADGYMPQVYAENHNFATYQIEKDARIDTSYTLYDAQSVERLIRENPDILPKPGRTTQELFDSGILQKWDKRVIQSTMIQGILQGESIPKLAKRMARDLGEKEYKSVVRHARTMTTATQNAGRVDGFKRAKGMGIDVKQTWVATLDGRTRHEHRVLDGQTREVGEYFEAEGYKIRYPGDPEAAYAMIMNCRCTLIGQIKGFERDTTAYRQDKALGGMTYDEWKNEKAKPSKTAVALGNASGLLSDAEKGMAKEYADRMGASDIDKFNKIFGEAEFTQGAGSYYDPGTNTIQLSDEGINDTTMFHEGTHYFDYNQNYKITADYGKYEYIVDKNGDLTGERKWVPDIVTIKEKAGFSEYIYNEWDMYHVGEDKTMAQKDIINFVKVIGTSDTYGYDRKAEDLEHDLKAINKYIDDKGISKFDPDYVHLSDFISAISYDANLGSLMTGGHSYDYWVSKGSNRVAEITASYNLLRATGRTDMLDIERELAPNLMSLIEKEWEKIW